MWENDVVHDAIVVDLGQNKEDAEKMLILTSQNLANESIFGVSHDESDSQHFDKNDQGKKMIYWPLEVTRRYLWDFLFEKLVHMLVF